MLLDTDVPGFELAWPLIFIMAGLSAGFMLLIANLAIRAHRKPVTTGRDYMINKKGRVLAWNKHQGIVKVQGETWTAKSKQELSPKQEIIVTSMDGLILQVKPTNRED